jgi:hypothetical protein
MGNILIIENEIIQFFYAVIILISVLTQQQRVSSYLNLYYAMIPTKLYIYVRCQ